MARCKIFKVIILLGAVIGATLLIAACREKPQLVLIADPQVVAILQGETGVIVVDIP